MGAVTPLRRPEVAEPDVYLSPEQVCQMLPGMTVRRLRGLREMDAGPRYSKPSAKTVLYTEQDVREWVRAHMITTREQS